MKSIYLFLLAAIVGFEFGIGAVVAPVIFSPPESLSAILSKFNSGILMSEIFVRFGYVLISVCIFSLLFEIAGVFDRCNFYLKFSRLMLSIICAGGAFLFVFYFTDFIINAQALGEASVSTQEFLQIHTASEYTLKIIMIAQVMLFFTRLILCKKK